MTASDDGLRFVLLRHEAPRSAKRGSHYDLMLERAGDLFTLELFEVPETGIPQIGRELAPHRKAYLDYEGPVSHNRGEVRRTDRGRLTIVTWSESTIEADLQGQTLRGRLKLERHASRSDESPLWQATFVQLP